MLHELLEIGAKPETIAAEEPDLVSERQPQFVRDIDQARLQTGRREFVEPRVERMDDVHDLWNTGAHTLLASAARYAPVPSACD